MYFRVEYDLSYWGGDYASVGTFVLVPAGLAATIGIKAAFEQTTGIDPQHIIHWSDELVER